MGNINFIESLMEMRLSTKFSSFSYWINAPHPDVTIGVSYRNILISRKSKEIGQPPSGLLSTVLCNIYYFHLPYNFNFIILCLPRESRHLDAESWMHVQPRICAIRWKTNLLLKLHDKRMPQTDKTSQIPNTISRERRFLFVIEI